MINQEPLTEFERAALIGHWRNGATNEQLMLLIPKQQLTLEQVLSIIEEHQAVELEPWVQVFCEQPQATRYAMHVNVCNYDLNLEELCTEAWLKTEAA